MRQLLLAILLVALTAHPYGNSQTLNAGLWWPLPGGHHCGIELKGRPGIFCDVD